MKPLSPQTAPQPGDLPPQPGQLLQTVGPGHLEAARQNNLIRAPRAAMPGGRERRQNGGSAHGYQAIFVSSAALASPVYDGQRAVYLYIAVLKVNVLICRGQTGSSAAGLYETLAMPGWSVAARTLLAEDGSGRGSLSRRAI